MNTISSVSSSNAFNPQITNKVAATNSTNLASNAANQSAFSSYIGQALAQIGVSNPTNSSAPVVSGANKAGGKEQEAQKTVSTFIQDLFTILTDKGDSFQNPVAAVNQQASDTTQQFTQNTNDNTSEETNEAIAAYSNESSATVGSIVTNLQTLVSQLNVKERDANSNNDSPRALESLKSGFQRILDAQGANADNKLSLGNFLQTLAQNLEGQSPLGIIINTQA